MPTETHEHFDAAGTLTGTTVVHRESEWNDYARSKALALGIWESSRCPSCGNYESLVLLPMDERHVTWGEHGDRKFTVEQFRCLACGASELVQRDWRKRHEKDEPQPGTASAGDGRMFVARPIDQEVS